MNLTKREINNLNFLMFEKKVVIMQVMYLSP